MSQQMEGWQSTPIVNIFKQCDAENKKNVELSGKVGLRMDEVIHKKVFRIVGSIPAVNFIKMPKDRPLGLTGRFLYLQVKFEPNAPLFAVHAELLTADGNTCRVSVGNIFKAENIKKKAGCVQLSLPDPPAGWTFLCLDLKAAAAAGGTCASPFKALKSVQLCSTITVRGAFSSDVHFGLQTLPCEMLLSHALNPAQVKQIWSPAEPTDVPEPVHINKPILPKKKPIGGRRHVTPRPDTAAAPGSDQTAAVSHRVSSSSIGRTLSKEISGLSLTTEPSGVSSCRSGGTAVTAAMAAAVAAAVAAPRVLLPDPYMKLQHVNGFTGEYCRSVIYNAATDELFFPAGSMVIALSANNNPAAADGGNGGGGGKQQQQQQRFFVGHTAFVSCMALGGQGTLLATGQEGKQPLIRLWDCSKQQEGQQGKCLAILCAHASNLAALDVSADGHALVACGADSVARQMIALWDIRDVRSTGKAQLLVKTVTSYHVRVLKFSPFEPDHFVSAGRDNIRCYRMKGDEIRGISIKMQAPLTAAGLVVGGAAASVIGGPKVFTDIAFEAASSGMQLQTQHMYVSTASGAVFQVDYGRRALTAVYQVHAAAINSLCIGEGLALTASDDTTLRLWPLDFSSYLLEAQHEAPVTSACLGSSDGLLLVAGCEDGSLGQLDVVSRQHTSLLRSHCGAVLDLAVHPTRSEYATTSTDGSLRIWDGTTHQQLLEFGRDSHVSASPGGTTSSSGNLCRASCAAFSPNGQQLVVGFREGLVRLFDTATMQMLQECQQHVGAITQLLFAADRSRLLSCGGDGRVVVYAVHHGLLPVKALFISAPLTHGGVPGSDSTPGKGKASKPAAINSKSSIATSTGSSGSGSSVCAAVSSDGCWIAVGQPATGPGAVGPDGGSGGAAVVLFNTALEAVLHIECTATSFNTVVFSPDSSCIWALATMPQDDPDSDAAPTSQQPGSSSDGSSLFCFSVADGSLLQQLPQPHGNAAVSSFALDAAGGVLATCGSDHLVRLWNVGPEQGPAVSQSFTAHHGAVAGAAFLGKQLLTVGADGNVCIWALTATAADGTSTVPAQLRESAAVAAVAFASGSPMQALQQEQQQQQQLVAAKAYGSLRSWLEPRMSAGAAVGVAGGVAVTQQQPVLVDVGIEPSPLFTDPVFSQQQQQQMGSASGAVVRRVDPLLSCSTVLGFDGSRCGVLWLKQAGLLAYTATNTLILFDLATKQQSFLSHHRQSISAVAVSTDAQLIATGSAAAEPAGGYADVAIWDVQRRCLLMLLQQHPVCVEQLAFSPDGAWLVSVGSGRVVVWEVSMGRATAVGAVKQAVSGIAWLPYRPLPSFVTCGGDGLLLWSLTPKFLEQRQLDIPDIALRVAAAAAAGSNQGVTHQCCRITRITAVCTAASSGGWVIDSLAPPASAPAAAAGCHDPVLQKQQREAAAVTVFAADRTGGVWQLALGEGRLCSCVRVTTLPPGESATALQWSQQAAALTVGTSSGSLLRLTCSSSSSSSSSSGGMGVHKGVAVSSGVETPATPAQAASQWWAAATGVSGGSSAVGSQSSIPTWKLCTAGSSKCSDSTIQQQHEQQKETGQLDGPIVRLCLEPHALCEGVVSTGTATAWYVDLQSQQKAPLLAGHTGQVNALIPVGYSTFEPLVASLGQDGRLAVWSASTGRANSSSNSSRGMAQVPLAEWCCADTPPTAAVFLPGQSATHSCCVLGHADGRIGLLELSDLSISSSSSSSSSVGTSRAAANAAGSGAGVLRWCVVRHPSAVMGLALHPNEPLVMAASRDGFITTTHTGTGELVATCKDLIGNVTPLHAFTVSTAAATAEGGDSSSSTGSSSVAAAAWLDKLLVFRAPWQADVAPVICSYQCPKVPEVLPAGIQSCVAFIPGSTSLLLFTSPCLGPTALLFDFTIGQPLRQLALTAQPASLAVAPAGQLFAFGLTDGCVLLTDAVAESSLELTACGGPGVAATTAAGGVEASRAVVQAVGFAAGGDKLLVAVGGVITVWDA